MKNKPVPALFIVIALKSPGPKWQKVSDPIPRCEAAMKIAEEWGAGRLARLIRPSISKVA